MKYCFTPGAAQLTVLLTSALAVAVDACDRNKPPPPKAEASPQAAAARQVCDADNGGIELPSGFCATVFAGDIGHARHIAVASNGDVYVNTWTDEQNNELPGELLTRVEQGDDFGWPYCYYDPAQERHVRAPEYGAPGRGPEGRGLERRRFLSVSRDEREEEPERQRFIAHHEEREEGIGKTKILSPPPLRGGG